ncbi:hypothetical protein D3C71_951710 [compost metagenome]
MDQLALAGLLFLFARGQRLVAVVDALLQEAAVLPRRQHRQQGLQRRADVAHHAQGDRVAATEVAAIAIHLDQRGLVRVVLAPGEIRAEQQQRVAGHQRVVARFDPEDAGHAHVVGVVMLDEILGPRGMRDRRLQALAQRHQRVVRVLAAGAGVDAHALALAQQRGNALQFLIAGAQHRLGVMHRERHIVLDHRFADVGRQDHHGHAAPADRRLAGQRHHATRLFGAVHLLAEHAAAGIHRLEIDLLRKLHAQLGGDHLAGDQHHGRAVAVGFEHAVDEMQATGSTRTGAGGELAADQRFGAGGERGHFLMAHVHPLDIAVVDGIGDVVEGVADDAVTMTDTGGLEGFNHDLGNALAHGEQPWTGDPSLARRR